MINPKVIFPDVDVRQEADKITILTSVRVPLEDGNGHYFWSVAETSYVKSGNYLQETLCRFNQMVYMAMKLGKINENLQNRDGVGLFKLDDNKETERERIKRIMLGKLGA
jgi:hypothetical protein